MPGRRMLNTPGSGVGRPRGPRVKPSVRGRAAAVLVCAGTGPVACQPQMPAGGQAAAGGVAGRVGSVHLVGATQQAAPEKVILVSYVFDASGVHQDTVRVLFGTPSPPFSRGDDYQVQLADEQGGVLSEYGIADPRDFIVERVGPGREARAIHVAKFRFDPAARVVRVLDSAARDTAVTTPLSVAIRSFCADRAADPDCTAFFSPPLRSVRPPGPAP